MTTEIVNIPLNKLAPFVGNVRKTRSKIFITGLAASLKEHGLQQNLVVKEDGKRFLVVAGGNRLLAFRQLAENGDIKATHPVPCKIATGDLDPIEISLLENVLREDMHPADEFEAFRDLVDKGVPVPDIAARFGVSDTVVKQRLKLARVSPSILKAYRGDRLNLEQVMAFAVSDDHAAQDHVLENLRPHDRSASTIRAALTENQITASDRRVKFVGLKAYGKAGGKTSQDLFCEGEDGVFILDAALLDRLVAEKLQRAAKSLTGEGWKWVDARPQFSYEDKSQLRRIHAEAGSLPPKLAKEAEALEQERETLMERWQAADDEAEQPERIGEIEDRLDAIEEKRGDDVWTPAQLGMAGVVLTIGRDGKAEIERGLVRPEDMPKKDGKAAKPGTTGEGETPEPQAPGLSAALIESLTAQRSAALAAELQQRPDVALVAVVHAFALSVMREGMRWDGSLRVTATAQSLYRVKGSKAHEHMEQAREKWSKMLPGEAELWAWCLEQKQEVLLDLLAYCAATTVNTVRLKTDRPNGDRLQHADRLAAALKLDMTPWFTPNAENYFGKVSKTLILDAIREVKQQPPAPAWEKLKKAELAQEAERQIAGSGWLPELLRPVA
jgi:ParB family transcriptional regulator, chromosome partitioning protein